MLWAGQPFGAFEPTGRFGVHVPLITVPGREVGQDSGGGYNKAVRADLC